MSVVLMICYARSGGTLLNKCLGSLPNVIIMSEVNPLGGGWGEKGPHSYTTVKSQAKNWYNIDLKSDDFVKSILELEQVCQDTGRQLIIRDWSFVNFAPYIDNQGTPPNRLLAYELLKERCHIKPFALVRDAIDIWLSRGSTLDDFCGPYAHYVETLLKQDFKIFKYEDLCKNPQQTIKEICLHTGMMFSDSYQEYYNFKKVNGDVQKGKASRGNRLFTIAPMPRQKIPIHQIYKLFLNKEISRINRLLGYSTSYFSSKLEGNFARYLLSEFYGTIKKTVAKHNKSEDLNYNVNKF